MNRISKSVLSTVTAGAMFAGCASPSSNPEACISAAEEEIMGHVNNPGEEFTAEFYVPNEGIEAVAVREEGSTAHTGESAINPLVIRCGGEVVAFASRSVADGPAPEGVSEDDFDREGLRIIDANGALFQHADEVGKSPAKTLTDDINAHGNFKRLEVEAMDVNEPIQNPNGSIYYDLGKAAFTDGTRRFGY